MSLNPNLGLPIVRLKPNRVVSELLLTTEVQMDGPRLDSITSMDSTGRLKWIQFPQEDICIALIQIYIEDNTTLTFCNGIKRCWYAAVITELEYLHSHDQTRFHYKGQQSRLHPMLGTSVYKASVKPIYTRFGILVAVHSLTEKGAVASIKTCDDTVLQIPFSKLWGGNLGSPIPPPNLKVPPYPLLI
jgi:hypothetical protein